MNNVININRRKAAALTLCPSAEKVDALELLSRIIELEDCLFCTRDALYSFTDKKSKELVASIDDVL